MTDRRIPRNRPVDRARNIATTPPSSMDGFEFALAMFTPAQLDELRASPDLPAIVETARETEAMARTVRRWLETLADGAPACTVCGEPVYGRADARYCSPRCRQRARRSRLQA